LAKRLVTNIGNAPVWLLKTIRRIAVGIGSATVRLLKTIRRMAADSVAKRVVTLDIDNTTVRLLATRGGRVRKWASASLEPEGVEGEVASDWQALGTTVKQLMKSSGINASKVTASLSGLYSLNRILHESDLPVGLSTREAVLQTAEETMPVSTDKLYLSWQRITGGADEQQFFVLGMPRDAVDNEMRSLMRVGIKPNVLELQAMALARIVNKSPAIVLNIGLSSFDIIIVVNGMPEIMRTILWQQGDLAVEDRVEQSAVTLELTADFYNLHFPDTPLDPTTPLFITGEMSGELILMEKLRARLVYPVEPLAPPLEYPAHLPTSQYAVNIGLALKGIASSENPEQGVYLPLDINLMPRIYHPWRPSGKQLLAFGFIIVLIALLFPLFQVASEAMDKTADLQRGFDILNNEMQLRKLQIKDREPLQQAISEYNSILNLGGNFTEDLEVIYGEAEKLGIHLGAVTHAGNSIDINCRADEGDYMTFREYITALEESGRFFTPIPPPEGYPYTTSGIIKVEPLTSK